MLWLIHCHGLFYRFFFDFSATYVGVGMICPYIINASVLLGGILSWGLMWPLIETRKNDWYSAELSPKSLHGLQGYKVCTFLISSCFLKAFTLHGNYRIRLKF
jgi:uncharacterized oligopeptide transporter (OPT) family protein